MPRSRKQVLIPLAPGYEEVEAIGPADVLARAGIRPVVASLPGEDRAVAGSHRLLIQAETSVEKLVFDEYAGIALPGGMPGALNLMNADIIRSAVQTVAANGGLVGAICAAPLVVQASGLTTGKRLTSHPSVRNELRDCVYVERPVVVDSPLITSRGPGTALLFGLSLVAGLIGVDKARQLAEKMMVSIPDVVVQEWVQFKSIPS